MKRGTIIFVILLSWGMNASVFAQNFESFEEFKRRSKKEFQQFVDKENAAFAQMLKERWVAFDALRNEQKRRVEPKDPIKYTPPTTTVKPIEIKVDRPTVELPIISPPTIDPPKVTPPKIDDVPSNHPGFTFEFYGRNCNVHIPQSFSFTLRSIDEKSVSTAFEELAKSDYKELINECLLWKEEMGLNDWYYKIFIDKMTDKFYGSNTNEQVVAQFFIFVQSGYNLKIGRCDQSLILMLPFNETLYSRSYLNIDGVHYYLFGNKGTQIFTYRSTPASGRSFSVSLLNELTLPKENQQKEVRFARANAQLKVAVNNNLRPCLSDYPQCDVINYAQAPLSKELKETLLPQLTNLVVGMGKTQAANLLINFVQSSFQYKTDPEQFGYERPLFAEELFIYPFSDCEDRSILFSQLVRAILKLDVVLLDYPDHIATAVCFGNEQTNGDFLMIEGKKYLVCDPTYINAPIGSTMPQYKNVSPKVWKIKPTNPPLF